MNEARQAINDYLSEARRHIAEASLLLDLNIEDPFYRRLYSAQLSEAIGALIAVQEHVDHRRIALKSRAVFVGDE